MTSSPQLLPCNNTSSPFSNVNFLMENLPQETIFHVLSFLSPAALLKVSLVSREWCNFIQDENIWKDLYTRIYKISDDDVTCGIYLGFPFSWKTEFKRNNTRISSLKLVQVCHDASDEVWKAKWSHNGEWVAAASKDGLCTIYLLKSTQNEKPSLLLYHQFHLGSAVSMVDWSMDDMYISATTLLAQVRIIDVKGKKVISTFPCVQFDTYARWLPDDSILLGSPINRETHNSISFLQHTIWRKCPLTSTGESASKTFTFLENCVHVLTYIPHSNSLAFCSGMHPYISNVLNLIFLTRIPGSAIVNYDQDIIWKDRPYVKDIVIAETGGILGITATECGRYLLINVRPFADPPPCFAPKHPVLFRYGENSNKNKGDTENINMTDKEETKEEELRNFNVAEGTIITPGTPAVHDRAASSFYDCLECLNMFEAKMEMDEDGEFEAPDFELGSDFEMHVWDLKEIKMVQVFKGHTATSPTHNPFCCGLSGASNPQMPYNVTGSEDAGVYIFHKAHKTPIHVLREHESLVNCAEFHPNGNLLITSSDDQTIHLWSSSEY